MKMIFRLGDSRDYEIEGDVESLNAIRGLAGLPMLEPPPDVTLTYVDSGDVDDPPSASMSTAMGA